MKALVAMVAVSGLILVGSLFWAAVADMCKDEIRTRLDMLPSLLIRVAVLRTPSSVRGDLTDEWNLELRVILRETEGFPLTRLLRGVGYAADLLLRGAPAVGREMTATASAEVGLVAPKRAEVASTTWSDLFPDGRHIFYEGNNPVGFVRQIEAEFGFNPALDPRWGEQIDGDDLSFISYRFHCPAEHLDAIYGTSRFPMGS
jgi:hypothetical protein